MNWRPIHTAPHDGTEIRLAWIVNWPTVDHTAVSFWHSGRWSGNYTPTHWEPLPRINEKPPEHELSGAYRYSARMGLRLTRPPTGTWSNNSQP